MTPRPAPPHAPPPDPNRDPARETLELVRAYHAIRDPALRAMVLGLVKGLGAVGGGGPLSRQGKRAA